MFNNIKVKAFKMELKRLEKAKKKKLKERKKFTKTIYKVLSGYPVTNIEFKGRTIQIDRHKNDLAFHGDLSTYGEIKDYSDEDYEAFKKIAMDKVNEVMDKILPKEEKIPLCAYCKAVIRGDYCHKCGKKRLVYNLKNLTPIKGTTIGDAITEPVLSPITSWTSTDNNTVFKDLAAMTKCIRESKEEKFVKSFNKSKLSLPRDKDCSTCKLSKLKNTTEICGNCGLEHKNWTSKDYNNNRGFGNIICKGCKYEGYDPAIQPCYSCTVSNNNYTPIK